MKLWGAVLGVLLSLVPFYAHADDDGDWGCTVLLCLLNPDGPTAVAPCVPPIEKLWRELSKGHGFPSCNNNGRAANTFTSPGDCPPQYLETNDNGQTSCTVTGYVTVKTEDGSTLEKVYWGGTQTVIDRSSPDAPANAATQRYEADFARWKKAQEEAEERRRLESY